MNILRKAFRVVFAIVFSTHMVAAFSQTSSRKTTPPPDIGVAAIVPIGADIWILKDYGIPYPLSDKLKKRLNVPDYHHGIDFQRRRGVIAGADVLAAASGRVALIRRNQCAGSAVVVEGPLQVDGNPLFVEYRHVGNIQVQVGQIVSRGEKIAAVEEDMQSFPCIFIPHLHLAVRKSLASDIHADVTNPNYYWYDGPGKLTCLDTAGEEPLNRLTLTVPLKC
ncbi:MAG: peptidoglycan DD-metalloendopeptidase family protein [Hyphomicrobiales bacterium]|nr:peptidoglycan DD-metalloendopeptidase family protein [Hyphomicrobiales bacterium]